MLAVALVAWLAVLVVAASAAHAAGGIECAPKPDDPTGYQVTAVGADRITAPATTPPIAVLDSGVASVPELAGRIQNGVNVVTGGQNTADLDGHGTAVATVAAGAAGGVRGVSPTSPILPVKILDQLGRSSADQVVAGIRAAVQHGARVINLSAATPAQGADPQASAQVRDAIWDAVSRGVVVIAPSGNEGLHALDLPAVFAHVLAVGATDQANAAADFSNQGTGLDLAAPGDAITTAAPDALCASGYSLVSGTSFAAPAASGAAALLLAANPALDVTQVATMLRFGPRPAASVAWNAATGFGLLDVPAALAAPVPPTFDPEVNDTIAWARRRPPLLTRKQRSRSLTGSLQTRFDPADVYRLQLARGARLRARVSPAVGQLSATLSDGHRVLARGLALKLRVRRSGSYFLSVTMKGGPASGTTYGVRVQR